MTTLEFEGMPSFTLAFENTSGTGSGGTGYPIASQAEAEAGITNTSLMTPLRTTQLVDARIATEAEAIAGVSTTLLITPATLHAVSDPAAALWFFDRANDLLNVTVPAGTDVIYRLGYAQRGDHEITRFRRKALSPTTAPVNNLAWEKDQAGVYFVNDMPRLDCRTMGVFADGQQLNGSGTVNTMTAGSNRVTLPGANFSAADVGKWIQVNGAGPLVENSSTVPPGTAHDGAWTDWLTGKIGRYVNVNTVDIFDLATGADLNATQTVTAAEAKTVYWVTDYTTQLQNAQRAAATMGKFLYYPGGANFYLSLKSHCGINGYSGIRIEGDGVTSRIVHGTAQAASDGFMFYIAGSLIERAHLMAPAAAGQDIIEVDTTQFMPIDSYLCLRDRMQPVTSLDQEEPYGVTNGFRGEIVRIREILPPLAPSTNPRFRLHAQLEEHYTADLTTVGLPLAEQRYCDLRAIIPVADCTFRNITLDHSKAMATSNTGVIAASRVLRFTIDNCFFPHVSYGVTIGTGIDWIIRNSRLEWIGMVDGIATDGDHDKYKGYGFLITSAHSGGFIQGCMARNVRHFMTSSAAGDIPPKHIHLSGISVQEGRVCVDTHPGADYWSIIDCHVVGGIYMYEVDQYGAGFQLRGHNNDVIDCSAAGVGWGIQAAFVEGTRIINFKSDFCDVGLAAYNCRDTEIINARVTRCRSMGFYWHNTTGITHPLQRFGYLKIKGFRMLGNPTQPTLVEDYRCDVPCGMQFGYYDSGGVFVPQWFPGITIEDWDMPDCVTPFVGADHEAVYGAGILDVATAQNLRVEEVAAGGIAALTSGTLFMSEIDLKIGRRFSQVGLPFATAGSGQTALWFGLFDRNRNCLALSNDLGTTAPSTTAVTFGSLSRTHVTREEGRHYIGACWVGSGTPPQVYGRSLAPVFSTLTPRKAGNSNTGLTGPASYPAISPATSTTLLTASLYAPAKELVTQSGKAFIPSMRVRIALTADPTKYFDGVVTSYSGTTLWVDCEKAVGLAALDPATLNAWTITANAVATAITATGNLAFVVGA